ncbi:lysine exporter LysO family protein [Kingella kingae]|uniref:lysine exporter LysO family protein n=1 Tax=Kingella kingae TaxID=504 RepID=UPI0003112C13|nr:lysine exporter LysO family protein [Kingella kingae]MDK4545564.1 lysine exporter LysO family protein [Kingella kingae]MDK4556098.1 lysine exporter LysO family protein [Kingella kingae]MDK4567505.1 lysine exporter LysO family protein [Kingella kingae]MDK4585184.1 lysine exporter LysO family protein [Kingella kingae]MDK4589166.1 lysine exporter LysO family protein [Kingella kingae]
MFQHLQTVFWILAPMFVGFAIRVPKPYLRVLAKILSLLVYVILLLIGIGLSQVNQLILQLDNILLLSLLLFGLLMACNLIALCLLDKWLPWQVQRSKKAACTQISWTGSTKQIAILLLGVAVGFGLPAAWQPPHSAGTYALMMLVFVVGIQLRSNGFTLRQILFNTRGIQVSLLFVASCAIAGCFFALLVPEVGIMQGLALSAGYGWYSLSGIVMTQAYGATWGSIALLNDLLREFFALAMIPVIMRRYPSSAVGVGGATSLDFTLPIIQSSGGIQVVPMAISFGFIINIVSPLLMILFSVK